ncbi:conserved Plasmodium protein, unknown function [Plasmodium gallinaceum]|uniref:Regulator of chromosome condensation n=1 Tax=Plasmodium gallinaceum TaxID=5849 RepID=A0A1J1GVH4_PLAGA|nr:conserved Plasmodium protein, unknown function [Plasmodium gallinaceum]CRG96485.1 conserved Plasmodium protein, unknown function [Plasmodium gallinaceum]
MILNEDIKIPLSNVYLYKNGELELIKELENVFIKRVNTCCNSINIVLNSNDKNKYNTLIKLNEANNCSSSYLNISYNDTCDFNFITSDLNLYLFYNNYKRQKEFKNLNNENSNKQYKEEFTANGKNIKNQHEEGSKKDKGILQRRNIKNFLLNNEKDNVWNYKIENIHEKEKKILHIIFEKIFFCSSEFYGINEEKEVYKWNIDIDNDKIIYNYHSKFINYINFSEKEKIIDISCGKNHALFLSKKKNCYACGSNYNYQVCEEKKIFYNKPKLVVLDKKKKKKVKYISAGYSHNLICTSENEIYGWGNNMHGQLLSSNNNFVKVPSLIFNQNIWNNLMKKKFKSKNKKKEELIINGNKKFHEEIKTKEVYEILESREKSFMDEKDNEKIDEIKNLNEQFFNLNNIKCKNKIEIKKICCGFSFSCILLKNKNCYIIGKTRYNLKENFNYPVKINKKKKIDNVFCNFFDIILVDHLKILKTYPAIIKSNCKNSIFLFFNFKIKNCLDFNIKLIENNFKENKKYKYSKIDKECKNNEELINANTLHPIDKNEKENYTEVFFHFNYCNDKIIYNLSSSNLFDSFSKNLCDIKSEHSVSCKINRNKINKKLFLILYNSIFYLNSNENIILSNYEGKIKSILPNNLALIKNIKIKIKINKAPIYVKKDYINVLYHFKDDKNEYYKFSRGRMNKKRKCIYTNTSFINSNNSQSSTLKQFNRCDIYFSLGNNFYLNSFPITIIKPEILNIIPNNVDVHDNKNVNINMLHLSNKFEYLHVILYNQHLQFIYKKAYYNSKENNYYFSIPLIPVILFKKVQSDFLKFNVFASYNNVEYSKNEIILTVFNV